MKRKKEGVGTGRRKIVYVLIGFAFCASALAETETFDSMTAGVRPPGWTSTMTGKGNPKWTVEGDETAPSRPNVLKQAGDATFPVCIKNNTSIKDGFVEARFKPVAGKEDQAGGIIWRCIDRDNYYVARANALENNVTIYHSEFDCHSFMLFLKPKRGSTSWRLGNETHRTISELVEEGGKTAPFAVRRAG